jgi:transcriptional regulator with XRE-family HTH domain
MKILKYLVLALLQNKVEIQKKIGANIASLRKHKNMTQIELSYLLDIDRQSVNRIEKGGTNISVYLLLQIADVLSVKPELILDQILT